MLEAEDKLSFNMRPQTLMRRGETSELQVGANTTARFNTMMCSMYLEVEEAWHVLLGAAVAVYCVLIKTY
jgi:hypothetical protein